MRTRQAAKNTTASLLLQIVLAISGVLVPRFFIIQYGSAVNGLASSITQFIGYMGLVEAGVSAAGHYKQAQSRAVTLRGQCR